MLIKGSTIILFFASVVVGERDRVASEATGISGGPCATNPCKNDGHCLPANNTRSGYLCLCTTGFYGVNCNVVDDVQTLEYIQVGQSDNFTLPTTFELAVANVDPICKANPCQNTGRCIPDSSVDNGYVCLCSRGWIGQDCDELEEGSLRHLRGHPSEEDVPESRMLGTVYTQWSCLKNGFVVDHVSIWWGHTSGDAGWACNYWVPFCAGQCQASKAKITSSTWNCYGLDPLVWVGTANIWWGHSQGDAGWACNNYWGPSACGKYGGCIAKHSWSSDGLNKYSSYVVCSGNGGACTAVSAGGKVVTLQRFDADKTDQQVMGCGGDFKLKSMDLGATLQKEPSAEVKLSFSQSDPEFGGWEGCCAAAGEAMQSRGYLSDGWYCQKDGINHQFGSTGIWLRGKAS